MVFHRILWIGPAAWLCAMAPGARADSRAEVHVAGSSYSDTHCAYASTTSTDLKFTLKETLTWGARARVRFAFHNDWWPDSADWQGQQELELTALAPDSYEARVDATQTASRGVFNDTEVQFVFEIIAQDGSTRWENGGSTMGYYQAILPAAQCDRHDVVDLPVTVVQK